MNYLIFGIGIFLGTCLGLLLAFLLGAAARQEKQMLDESEQWENFRRATHDTASPKD